MEIFVKIQKKKLLFDTEQEHFIALSLKKKRKKKENFNYRKEIMKVLQELSRNSNYKKDLFLIS